jgi:hypothetical protein
MGTPYDWEERNMEMDDTSITSETVRMYHAVRAGAGKELADKLFPHVNRFLARLDTGVRNTAHFQEADE